MRNTLRGAALALTLASGLAAVPGAEGQPPSRFAELSRGPDVASPLAAGPTCFAVQGASPSVVPCNFCTFVTPKAPPAPVLLPQQAAPPAAGQPYETVGVLFLSDPLPPSYPQVMPMRGVIQQTGGFAVDASVRPH
jgi:hypothetical protein